MYRKFLVALAGALALAVADVFTDNRLTTVEWVQIVIAAATAVQVWLTANVPSLSWAKTLTAVVLGVANVLIGVIADGLSAADITTMIVAGFAAAGVYAVSNGSPATSGPRPVA